MSHPSCFYSQKSHEALPEVWSQSGLLEPRTPVENSCSWWNGESVCSSLLWFFSSPHLLHPRGKEFNLQNSSCPVVKSLRWHSPSIVTLAWLPTWTHELQVGVHRILRSLPIFIGSRRKSRAEQVWGGITFASINAGGKLKKMWYELSCLFYKDWAGPRTRNSVNFCQE